MIVNTSRFGKVEIDAQRIITFAKGLLGFPAHKQFVLIEPAKDSYFWWLQSVDAAELAFVVTDPVVFVSSYKVPIKPEQMEEMGLSRLEDAQVLVIVNKRDNLLTGNLQGPLVINTGTRTGEQLVLSDRRFTTRVPLLELPQAVEAMAG